MNNIKISFIVPVFNSEKYLERCVRSIVKYPGNDIEIILINDGSTDKSSDIINVLSKNDARIKFIHKSNSGVSEARNSGVKMSSGEYLFFIDNDDYIVTNEIENIINIISKANPDVILHKYNIVQKNKIIKKNNNNFTDQIETLQNKDQFLEYIVRNRINIIAPWEYIVKKSIININQIYFNRQISGIDDSLFTPKIFCNCNNFYMNKNVVYNWEFRDNSQGKTHNNDSYIEKVIISIELLKSLYEETGDNINKKYIQFSIYKSLFSLFSNTESYTEKNKATIRKYLKQNNSLVSECSNTSGAIHSVIVKLFGSYFGLVISHKIARLKGFLTLGV